MNLVPMVEKIPQRTIIVALACLFVFTHAWVLLSFDALYWDDWSILTSESADIHQMFKFVGFELAGTIHAWLAPLGAGAYKILMLVCLAVMSTCVFLIAQSYRLTTTQAGWITALFIVAPLNTSKIAAVNVLALVFAAVFFLAWLLLLRDLHKPTLVKRLCALALFSLAFYLPSSLAFFALPGMSIAWHAYHSSSSWRQRLGVFFKRADFLILPFVQFAIFRLYFFKPHASIANEYQKFGVRGSRLQEALERLQTDFLLDMPWTVRIVLVVLPMILLLRLVKHSTAQDGKTIQNADRWMLAGLFACFFAILPYLAVGRLPVFSDWNSRYQLFLPLGFALICWSVSLYVAAYLQQKRIGLGACVLLLTLSAGFTIRSYFEYSNDWQKQKQLIAALRDQRNINPDDNIVFVDSVDYAKRRILRHYEYSEMMRNAQPLWRGFAMSLSQLQKVGNGSLTTYLNSLGKIADIEATPRIFGLSSNWRWSDRCLVLIIYESGGHIQVRRADDHTTMHGTCVLSPERTFQ